MDKFSLQTHPPYGNSLKIVHIPIPGPPMDQIVSRIKEWETLLEIQL
jgi:hypothetical protein